MHDEHRRNRSGARADTHHDNTHDTRPEAAAGGRQRTAPPAAPEPTREPPMRGESGQRQMRPEDETDTRNERRETRDEGGTGGRSVAHSDRWRRVRRAMTKERRRCGCEERVWGGGEEARRREGTLRKEERHQLKQQVDSLQVVAQRQCPRGLLRRDAARAAQRQRVRVGLHVVVDHQYRRLRRLLPSVR